MPNATFTADFNDFIGQTQKADAQLGDLETRAERTQAALNSATGTAPAGLHAIATETAAVSNEMSGLIGIATSVGGALGAAWSVDAAIRFAGAVIEDASALEKMSARTGVSVEGLQTLRSAGDDAGNTMEQLGNAVNMMQKNLTGGSSSVVAALSQLHLNLTNLRSLAPETQFTTIAEAIASVRDPAEQVALAIAIFGRQGAEILPTLKRNFDDVGDSASQMSTRTVKSLDEVGNEWKRFKASASADAGTAIAFLIEHFSVVDDSAKGFQDQLAQMEKTASRALPAVASGFKSVEMSTLATKHAEDDLTESVKEQIRTYNDELKVIDERILSTWKNEAEAAKILDDVETKLHKGFLDRYKAQTEAAQRMTTEINAVVIEGALAIRKVQEETDDAVAKATLSSTDYQIREIWRVVTEEERAFKGSLEQRAAYNALVEAMAQKTAAALIATQLTVVVGGASGFNQGQIPNTGPLSGVVASTGPGPLTVYSPPGSPTTFNGLPRFQGGGPVLNDGPIFAHAGEFVLPKGSGGGMTINITNNILNPLGTPDSISRAISDATIAGMRNRGIRLPTGA